MSRGFDMNHLKSAQMSNLARQHQRGVSLILVMIVLTVVSMIGVAGIQISVMGERGARNDRDYQVAWQSAEAGLMDAENDLWGPGASSRRSVFGPITDLSKFVDGCGTSSTSIGLCTINASGKPAWVKVDFDDKSSSAPTTEYGKFTGRSFTAGGPGIQPAKKPRYVIEAIQDSAGAGSSTRKLGTEDPKYVFRVTSMGFGPRADIQAVVQIIYRN